MASEIYNDFLLIKYEDLKGSKSLLDHEIYVRILKESLNKKFNISLDSSGIDKNTSSTIYYFDISTPSINGEISNKNWTDIESFFITHFDEFSEFLQTSVSLYKYKIIIEVNHKI